MTGDRVSRRALVITLLCAIAALLLCELRYRASSVPHDREFSATRAREALARVLGDGAPHPTGSVAAAAVRARIVRELESLGLTVDRRTSYVCARRCADVENLSALVRGRAPTGLVLLVAHSDSVAAGPGASDDGAGIAALLESTRALIAAPVRNDVLVLFTDGEELGLLGARAFAANDARTNDVRFVINVEARGTHGPSFLFQTGRDAGVFVSAFAHAAPRPIGSSLLPWVYARMPNDTDFSVFLARGLQGFNFAYGEGIEGYHTPLDDLAHQSEGSVQHQGESVLAALRVAGEHDFSRPAANGDLVFFDVAALFVPRWPLSAAPLVAAIACMLVGVAIALLRPRGVLAAAARFLAALLLSTLFATLVFAAARIAGVAQPFVERPAPLLLALSLVPIAVVGFVAARTKGPDAMTSIAVEALGVAATLAVLGVVSAFAVPGGSYLPIVPAASAGVAGVAVAKRAPIALIVIVPGVASIFAWALVLHSLSPMLGFAIGPAYAPVALLAGAPFAPLAYAAEARVARRVALSATLACLVCTLVALLV